MLHTTQTNRTSRIVKGYGGPIYANVLHIARFYAGGRRAGKGFHAAQDHECGLFVGRQTMLTAQPSTLHDDHLPVARKSWARIMSANAPQTDHLKQVDAPACRESIEQSAPTKKREKLSARIVGKVSRAK
jgi:hypothetical protein